MLEFCFGVSFAFFIAFDLETIRTTTTACIAELHFGCYCIIGYCGPSPPSLFLASPSKWDALTRKLVNLIRDEFYLLESINSYMVFFVYLVSARLCSMGLIRLAIP